MIKHFQEVADVIADETFLAWYHQEGQEQVEAWETWRKANPVYEPLILQAIAFMQELPGAEATVPAAIVEAKLQQLHQRIDELETVQTPVVSMRSNRRRWISIAAAILLLAGGFSIWKLTQSSADTVNTKYGEICNNKLPDGSTMILNANSNAKLSEGWKDGQDREVWLDGEAYFHVQKTPQKSRFIVHTGQLDVIVTGTQFNVLHRDNKTSVLLTEGSVIIRTSDGKELAMKPGDYVEMLDNEMAKKDAKEENILAWKDNKLAFDKTPIRDVAKMITNHYGVTVQINDESVKNVALTGIMSNTNLDDLLKAIEMLGNVKVEKKGNDITISGNK